MATNGTSYEEFGEIDVKNERENNLTKDDKLGRTFLEQTTQEIHQL